MTVGYAAWRVESLRCTSFLATGGFVQKGMWESVVGQVPERVTERPRVQTVTEIGVFGAGQLQYSASPLRADWVYATRIEAQADNLDEVNFDGMGTLSDALGALDVVVNAWFRNAPTINRLALGSVLHIPTESVADAYRALDGMLPDVKVPAEGASDFLFQVNRPRGSRVVEGLQLNRLSKWSVARMQLQIQTAGSPKLMDLKLPLTACRLELDLSSTADRELPLHNVAAIWRELTALAQEIAERGDVP